VAPQGRYAGRLAVPLVSVPAPRAHGAGSSVIFLVCPAGDPCHAPTRRPGLCGLPRGQAGECKHEEGEEQAEQTHEAQGENQRPLGGDIDLRLIRVRRIIEDRDLLTLSIVRNSSTDVRDDRVRRVPYGKRNLREEREPASAAAVTFAVLQAGDYAPSGYGDSPEAAVPAQENQRQANECAPDDEPMTRAMRPSLDYS
jgi:hypothetical protein